VARNERRPEDGPDADLARGLGIPAREDSGQDGDHGDHGFRQRGADGGEHAPDRPLSQVQPSTQDLDRVSEERGGDNYRTKREREL
jgi:hypothetical protein